MLEAAADAVFPKIKERRRRGGGGGQQPASALNPHSVPSPQASSTPPKTARRRRAPHLLGAPLAFVEDVPQDKYYFGPEQPQRGLESPLHLPFPVRADTAGQRDLLSCFVYTRILAAASGGLQTKQEKKKRERERRRWVHG